MDEEFDVPLAKAARAGQRYCLRQTKRPCTGSIDRSNLRIPGFAEVNGALEYG